MQYFKFAARVDRESSGGDGRRLLLTAIGQSNVSHEDAQQNAETRWAAMNKLVETPFANRDSRRSYEYGERPVAEELIKELWDEQGSLVGALTRNRYGAIILNTPHVGFFDIDFPEPTTTRASTSWFGLFRKAAKPSDLESQPDASRRELIQKLDLYPSLSFRIYRTAAGFRVVVLNRLLNPDSEETKQLFQDLGCDKLYCRLCQTQECFRARLTPKPWRCGLPQPPGRYPREHPKQQQQFATWLQRYNAAMSKVSVCNWVQEVGTHPLLGEIDFVLSIHDAFTIHDTPGKLA